MSILAIDPGRSKFGLAVVSERGELILQEQHARDALSEILGSTLQAYTPAVIILGAGTSCDTYEPLINGLAGACRVVRCEESGTTIEARSLWLEHETWSFWERLLPNVVRVAFFEPALDGYAAYAIALRWLERLDGESIL